MTSTIFCYSLCSLVLNSNLVTPFPCQCHYSSCQVSQAMSKHYLKISLSETLKDAIKCMQDSQQNCVLVVDGDGFLEGILTYGDIRRCRPDDNSKSDSGIFDVCRRFPWSLYMKNHVSVCNIFFFENS